MDLQPLLLLMVIGVLLYFIPMEAKIKQVLVIIVVVAAVIFLLIPLLVSATSHLHIGR